MIKALIIDDEPSAVNTLTLMLRYYAPEITELKSTTYPHEGLQLIQNFKPSLVFLDIQMPYLNGLDLLKSLPQIDFGIIFTTAHDQYAIEAIRFSALDYLLKPLDGDELRMSIDRFLGRSTSPSNRALYNNFLHNISVSDKKDFKLALPSTEGTYFYIPDEIVRLQGENNYTNFFFTSHKPMLVPYTLKKYEEILSDHDFIRVHKSHMVNKKHVVRSLPDGLLEMVDHSRVEISRRRKKTVMEALKSN